MRFSQAPIPLAKSAPRELSSPGLALLHRSGFARHPGSKRATWYPLAIRVLTNLEALVRRELRAIGAHEISTAAEAHTDVIGRNMNALRVCQLSSRQLPSALFECGRTVSVVSYDESAVWAETARGRLESLLARVLTAACIPSSKAQTCQPGRLAPSTLFWSPALGKGSIELAVDPETGYAASAELASRAASHPSRPSPGSRKEEAFESVLTPDAKSMAELTALLDVPASAVIKTLLVIADGTPLLACIRGDRSLSLALLAKAVGTNDVQLASEEAVTEILGCAPGFVGPVGAAVRVIADSDLRHQDSMVCGALENDTHLRNVALGRDATIESWQTITQAQRGDRAAQTGNEFEWLRAAPLGYVTSLGAGPAEAADLSLAAASGSRFAPHATMLEIDLLAVMLAAAEHHSSPGGIAWPSSIAPFDLSISVLSMNDAASVRAGDDLYKIAVDAGLEVLLDERPKIGMAKLDTARLMGAPVQIALGARSIARLEVEIRHRQSENPDVVPIADAYAAVVKLLAANKKEERNRWT